jgi:hypothetical protein
VNSHNDNSRNYSKFLFLVLWYSKTFIDLSLSEYDNGIVTFSHFLLCIKIYQSVSPESDEQTNLNLNQNERSRLLRKLRVWIRNVERRFQ